MAQAKSTIERNNFAGGLVTEVTALNYPPNSAIDIDNFELNRDGSLSRRLGMIVEGLGAEVQINRDASVVGSQAITTYQWKHVDNDPTVSINVVQIGNQLWFLDSFSDTLSTNLLNKDEFGVAQPVVFDSSILPTTISGNEPMSFASIAGILIVASKEMDYPVYLEYTGATDTIGSPVNVTPIRLKCRDLWGVDDGLEVDERPNALSSEHNYNLKNQGWFDSISKSFNRTNEAGLALGVVYPDMFEAPNSQGALRVVTREYVGNYRMGARRYVYNNGSARQYNLYRWLRQEYGIEPPLGSGDTSWGVTGLTTLKGPGGGVGYPSNSDLRPTGNGVNSDGNPAFRANQLNLQGSSTTPAPRGRFVLDAFDRVSSRVNKSGVSLDFLDKELGKVSQVAVFANRVFYSGIDSVIEDPDERSPDYTGSVFFTQSIENFKQLEECYQVADPTSEDDFALVATDGGFLKIAEAANIVKLVVARSSLVVIAENGVWEVSGVDGVFKATEYTISQVSNVGCVSSDSVVVAEDNVFYWGDGGIYVLTPDQVSGKLNAQNITETTIQTRYNEIPSTAKAFVKGRFDPVNRKITWLYNDSDSYDGVTFKHNYNRELIFDTVLSAFYLRTIGDSSDGRFISGFLSTESFVVINDIQNVVVNGEQVVVNGENVVVAIPQRNRGTGTTKYLTLSPKEDGDYQFTASLYGGLNYNDWGEVDSPAYIITGHELGGDTQRSKQIPYLTMNFNRTETGFTDESGELEAINPSSCTVTARWSFSDNISSGKWGVPFEAYRLNRNYLPTGTGDSFDYGQSVVTSKTKVRGRGVSISFKFETSPLKDCNMIGWAMPIVGGTVV